MSRIRQCFATLKAQQRKGLILFVTAGDPDLRTTVEIMHAMVAAGADILELGVPFSDPMAEGPTIQKSSERALQSGTHMHVIFDAIRQFRSTNAVTPVVLMGYLNPIEAYGYASFARDAHDAGVDGVITVDMPVEESADYGKELTRQGLDVIFLIAPTSSLARIKLVNDHAKGFIYYVSLKGVTGADAVSLQEISLRLQHIRENTHWPLAVGFGIKAAAQASELAKHADAVVIGSAIVAIIEKSLDQKLALSAMISELKHYIASVRTALDNP